MNRLAAIGFALLIGIPDGAPAQAPLAPETIKAIADVQAAAQKQDCAALIPPARIFLADTNTPEGKRAGLYQTLVFCEEQLKQTDAAYKDALAATALSASSDRNWLQRIGFEIRADNRAATLTTIERMAETHPVALGMLDIELMGYLHSSFDKAKDETSDTRLLKVLATAYTPDDPSADTDGFKVLYARKLVAHNDIAEARTLLNAVVRLDSLMDIALDKDLRGVRDAPIDFGARANQQLVDDQAKLAAHPESMGLIATVAHDLKRLGKYQAALDVLDAVAARINDPKAFADQEKVVNWWWNERAYAYHYLGDYPHTVESFRAGINAGERGHPNVSQLLNMAEVQIRFRRFDEALATLAPGANVPRSSYGDMVYHETHGCAAFRAGKTDLAAIDVAYVRAHETDAPSATGALLLCVGDVEGAVAVTIRALADPERRVFLLRELSDYVPDPPTKPIWPGDEKWDSIKQRPDMKAAIQAAGGTLRFPYHADMF